MESFYIWTIGCQMNKAESERLGGFLEQSGYTETSNPETADFIVLNSCVVREHAENRVVNKLQNLKTLKKSRPTIKIALTGCMVHSKTEELKRQFPYVDYFIKPGNTLPLSGPEPNSAIPLLPAYPKISTFVTIMQGCNNFCSYCIVPYRRGREKSRSPDDIICEIKELVKRGTKEVILLGQNVDSYGHDLPDNTDLASLLETVANIDGIERIRFLTNHPKDMNNRLISAIAGLNKVCPDINLPVQAGDNVILDLMRRGYTVEHYRDLVQMIRKSVPGIGLTTDIIVGFPSESTRQYENSLNLVKELRFDGVHVAAYSPRKGTSAARDLVDDIPAAEKKRRLGEIEAVQAIIATEINASFLSQTAEVLVEGRKSGKWFGRTRNGKLVFFKCDDNCSGNTVQVTITKTSPWSLQGELTT